jgi:hypothetical protein
MKTPNRVTKNIDGKTDTISQMRRFHQLHR